MNADEHYHITNQLAKSKLANDSGEIWTYPALHIFRGRLSKKIVKDVTEYCVKTDNNTASDQLIANMKGTQSHLNKDDPLLKDYIEKMMISACTYVDQCQMNYEDEPVPRRVEIHEMWDVKMKPGDYNLLHIHQTPSHDGLSSITYIKVPDGIRQAKEKSDAKSKALANVQGPHHQTYLDTMARGRDGWLKILWGLSQPFTSGYTCATNVDIQPRVGDFYIFPKTLHHMVNPFHYEEDRWSVQINFNCWAEGEG